jgi:hypothetical protein
VEITKTAISAITRIVAIALVVITYSLTKGSIKDAPFYSQSSAYRFISNMHVFCIKVSIIQSQGPSSQEDYYLFEEVRIAGCCL